MSLALLKLLFTLDLEHSIKRLLLVFLAYKACTMCGRVYASVSTMAQACNTTPAYIKQILRELIQSKLVAKTGEKGPKGVTVYWLPGVRLSIPDEFQRVCLDAPRGCVYTHPIDKKQQDSPQDFDEVFVDERILRRFLNPNGNVMALLKNGDNNADHIDGNRQ